MKAMIHMQPLNTKREPMYPRKCVGFVERGETPHRVGGSWELNSRLEMPYFVRVWADNKFGGDFEVDLDAPTDKLRHLTSVTFYQMLTVLPRRDS